MSSPSLRAPVVRGPSRHRLQRGRVRYDAVVTDGIVPAVDFDHAIALDAAVRQGRGLDRRDPGQTAERERIRRIAGHGRTRDAAHDTLIVCAGSHTANARENAPCWTRAAAVAVPAFAAYRRRHASHVAQSNTPDREPP